MLLLLFYTDQYAVIGQYLGSPCMTLVYKDLFIICCRLVVGVVVVVYRAVWCSWSFQAQNHIKTLNLFDEILLDGALCTR